MTSLATWALAFTLFRTPSVHTKRQKTSKMPHAVDNRVYPSELNFAAFHCADGGAATTIFTIANFLTPVLPRIPLATRRESYCLSIPQRHLDNDFDWFVSSFPPVLQLELRKALWAPPWPASVCANMIFLPFAIAALDGRIVDRQIGRRP